jgi:hypothetical protein
MRAVLVLVVLAVAGVVAGLTISVGGDANAGAASEAAGGVGERAAVDFDHYDAGAAVEGIQKSETVRRCEPDVGAPTRINMVVTFYGSCEPAGSDGGCAPPVQVQSWPSCERNLALYEKYPEPDGPAKQYTKTTIRGVPAAIFDDGRRIEVYTGTRRSSSSERTRLSPGPPPTVLRVSMETRPCPRRPHCPRRHPAPSPAS